MKYYSIGKFTERIDKTSKIIRLWNKQEILKLIHVTASGKILFPRTN